MKKKILAQLFDLQLFVVRSFMDKYGSLFCSPVIIFENRSEKYGSLTSGAQVNH